MLPYIQHGQVSVEDKRDEFENSQAILIPFQNAAEEKHSRHQKHFSKTPRNADRPKPMSGVQVEVHYHSPKR
jgi:hypothetical protein